MKELIFRDTDHTYWLGPQRLVSVTEVLNAQGFVDSRWFTEASRDRGVKVHLALEYFNENRLDIDSLHPTIAGRVIAYQRFLDDTGFQVVGFEERLSSEAHACAGTLDLRGVWGADNYIIDFKSGPVAYWTGMQTAAYEMLARKGPHKRAGLELMENGKYKLTRFESANDRAQFVAALSNYYHRLANGAVRDFKPLREAA